MKAADQKQTVTLTGAGLTCRIAIEGGELWSLKDHNGAEYLWQGDPAYWPDRAPNLFPYVGRVFGGRYSYAGSLYPMDIHGFVKDMRLEIEEQSSSQLVLKLTDSDVTRRMYPFGFVYRVRYGVQNNRLDIEYTVENKDEKTMYFGLGGHPGFQLPMDEGLAFTDYRLEFSPGLSPIRIGLDDKCFRDGKDFPYALQEGRYLPLRHDLFDHDAIILSQCGQTVTLTSPKGKAGVRVFFPQMPYLGIWHTTRADAPFVCLEPWTSLPSWQNAAPALETQADLLTLAPGKTYQNRWAVDIVENCQSRR